MKKLGELFEDCEKDHTFQKVERNDYLFCFFCIYKGLITLNDQGLLEILMSTPFFMQTFGALEWDPEALVEETE